MRRYQVWLVLAVALLLAGCGNGRAQATRQADALLARVTLHPAGAESWKTVTIWATEPFSSEAGVSSFDGLSMNLIDLAGEKVQVLSIPLQERVEGDGHTLRAYFFVKGATVIGAYMEPDDSATALQLSDGGELVEPGGLSPDHLVFPDVRDITLERFSVGDVGDPVHVTDRARVKTILTMLSASRRVSGSFDNATSDEVIDLNVTYENDRYITLALTTRCGSRQTLVRFGSIKTFDNCYFVAPAGLRTYVTTLLGSK